MASVRPTGNCGHVSARSGLIPALRLAYTPGMATRQLRLSSTANTRASLARVIRSFDAAAPGDPDGDPVKFRALVHAFSTLLAFDKHALETERLADIEARLAAIEAGDDRNP